MSSVIKQGNFSGQSGVNMVMAHPSATPIIPIGKHDEERDALLRRIAKLEEEIRQREAAAGELRAAVTQAREDGMEEGYEAGLAAAQDRQSERLALLEKSMIQAQANLAGSLASFSRLSALLAQDCVDIVLGNASDRVDIIRRIIEAQAAKIDRSMLVAIRVSRLDFPEDHKIESLREETGLTSINVTAADDMPSGSCLMTLRLGSISVGIDQQWPALRRLLDELALPEAME
ncbi:MAG TPA: hypothetical protein VJ750_02290 [Rhizomicrobium sp.]|nr:hypothetical protein [Rhizomicrobium sp.]